MKWVFLIFHLFGEKKGVWLYHACIVPFHLMILVKLLIDIEAIEEFIFIEQSLTI